jgi:hypothetical protein
MSNDNKLNKLVREGVDPEDIDDYYADELEVLESESRVDDDDWK